MKKPISITFCIVSLFVFGALLFQRCAKKQAEKAPGAEIPIGVLLPFSGDWAWIGAAANGAELAAWEINNEAGGIRTEDGEYHHIKLYSEDTATNPDTAVLKAGKLYFTHNVLAILGPTSLTVQSIMPITKEAEAVQISPTAGTTVLNMIGGGVDGENVYRTVSSDIVMGSGMVWYAKNKLNAKKVGLFFVDNASARSIHSVIIDAIEILGLEKAGEVFFPEGQSSSKTELVNLFKNKPDVVFFESGSETDVEFLKEWFELKLGGLWLGTDFISKTFLEAAGSASEGIYAVNPGPLRGSRFNAWLEKYRQITEKPELDQFAVNAYDAMNIIALALEKSGEISRVAIAENIRAVSNPPGTKCHDFKTGAELLRQGKDIDYDGVAGHQDFNRYGDPITYLKVEIVENGRLKRIDTLAQDTIGNLISMILEQRIAPE